MHVLELFERRPANGGAWQDDDIPGIVRYRTYEVLKKEAANPSLRWAYLPYSMHMAGPREAIQHMIIRKNYGEGPQCVAHAASVERVHAQRAQRVCSTRMLRRLRDRMHSVGGAEKGGVSARLTAPVRLKGAAWSLPCAASCRPTWRLSTRKHHRHEWDAGGCRWHAQ
jgi:ATP-sulfurylase